MKNLTLCLFVLLSTILTPLLATPGDGILDLELPCVDGNINQEVCIPIVVDDLNNLSFGQVPIQWDPTKLEFTTTKNNFFTGTISVENQEEGTLRYIFQDGTLSNPLSAPDGSVLFEVCFNVLTDGPTLAFVEVKAIDDVPPPFTIEFIDEDGDTVAFDTKKGGVAINITKVAICVNNPEMVVGEVACFPLKTASFTNVQSFQFSLDFDPAIMTFTEAINMNAEMTFDMDAFNLFEPGNLRLSWFSFQPGGITVDDGSVIAEFCFDVIALPPDDQILTIGDQIPNGIEATDAQNNLLTLEDNCSGLTSIFDLEKNAIDFSLFPNPASDNIEILTVNNSRYRYEILDVQGKIVQKAMDGNGDSLVDINGLDSGVYFVRITQENKVGTRKFVKF